MKVCPVCRAKAFDDAEVCYGCLHRFGRDAPMTLGRHGVHAPQDRCGALPADEPPPECYQESYSLPLSVPASSSTMGRRGGTASSSSVSAHAHWRRGDDGRWWLRVDVPLPQMGF